jgi:hypothetical protein
MKQVKQISFLVMILALVATACRKKDLAPGVQPINIILKVNYDTANGNYKFPLTDIKVKLTNTLNNTSLTAATDNNGLAIFNSVSAGTYNAEASITIKKAQYEAITGFALDRDSVTFNAAISNAILNNTSNNTLELKLLLGKLGDWVLKQVYFAGSHTVNGAIFRDQFIEIYNNSNHVLYADSLYICQAMGSNTVSPNVGTGYYINDNGPFHLQYDWNKSIGMTGTHAVTDYFYAKTLFRIPGNGTTYPVQPGKSIVVAATALNHKAPYTSTTGTSISIGDPSLTVDLSQANFEIYLGALISNPLPSDLDNPTVTNLEVIERANGRDLVLDNPGRDAILIFKTNKHFPLYNVTGTGDYPRYPDPTVTSIISTTSLYYQIPNSVVIDGVQLQHTTPASRVPRRISIGIDAGQGMVTGGQYSSQALIRKTASTVSGRKVLMDTNNSNNDFTELNRALPGAFAP